MDWISNLMNWFAGGRYEYYNLYHCMKGDRFWVAVTVVLDLAVAAGYVLIALHWRKQARNLPPIPAKAALASMRNIFVFCVLVYFTWKYAWGARDLKVVYNELGRSNQLAEDLAKSQAEARRKSTFLNAVSHDLRTPLNGVVLQADVAEMSVKHQDFAALQEALSGVKASARSAAAMLEELLDFARIDGGSDEPVIEIFPLSELLRATVRPLEPKAAEKKLYLQLDVPGELNLRSDRARMRRILTNLIDNALKIHPARRRPRDGGVGRRRGGDSRHRHGHRHRRSGPRAAVRRVFPGGQP